MKRKAESSNNNSISPVIITKEFYGQLSPGKTAHYRWDCLPHCMSKKLKCFQWIILMLMFLWEDIFDSLRVSFSQKMTCVSDCDSEVAQLSTAAIRDDSFLCGL